MAAGVVAMSAATILFDLPWMTAVIAYGFAARVATGPTLSPLAQIVTRWVTPRLGVAARPVPGPPKRFAQLIGLIFSLAAAILALALDQVTAAYIVLGVLVCAASLEAFVGLCLGCRAFAVLMRAGVIPASVCERCADIGLAH